MGLALAYDAANAAVALTGTTYGATVAYVVAERATNPQLTQWAHVRGGVRYAATAGTTVRLTDREFDPNVANTYRVRAFNGSDVEVPTYSYTGSITPSLGRAWLRSPTLPFLDRPVTITDFTGVEMPARGALLEVLGRRDPVAVTQVRGSRRFALTLIAEDQDERDALELFLSFGSTVFLHNPDASNVPASGHFHVADVSFARTPRHDSPARYVSLPLTACAAPDPSIVASTVTWAGVVANWATWAAVVADPAVPTWLALSQYVSAPTDEVVG